jgi:phosphoribosyl-ATP pyrophosphohydrolase
MGYHVKEIVKAQFGTVDKIREEFEELMDAYEQGNPLMFLHEMSDMLGAMEAVAAKYNVTLVDLITMKEATQRAFKSGHRR